VLIISLFPSGCRQGFLTKSPSVRESRHGRGSDRPSSNPNALLVVSIDLQGLLRGARARQFHKFRSSRAIMERRCGGGRLVREIQYKNTSYRSRSRICMHGQNRKIQVLLYLMVLFVFLFVFFLRGAPFPFFFSSFFFALSRSRSLLHPSLRGRGGGMGGGAWGVRGVRD